ncbi:MAG: hypothetical protein IJX39_06300 [Clostridia bacterium]|nr:hypothetical protein [Clostridia bacterium]
MKKRFLALLLTLCLVIGMGSLLGTTVFAAEATAVATVTAGQTEYTALTFTDALNIATINENSTLKLLDNVTLADVELGGDYTIDLNGKTMTVTSPLTVSVGIVTVTDTSAGLTGRIAADRTSALVLKGGSLKLTAGTVHSVATFAIQNRGTGEIFLSGKPAITSDAGTPLYVGYANTLNGNDGAGNAYTGNQIAVSCGWSIAEDTIVAKNATCAQFNATDYRADRFVVEEQDGNLVISKIAMFTWVIVAVLGLIALGLVIFTVVHTVQYKRKMKFYSFSFPALLAVLAFVTPTQQIAMIVSGVICAVAIAVCAIATVSQNKKLAAAKAAKAEQEKAEKAAKIAAEQACAAEKVAEEAPAEVTAVVEEAPAEDAPAEEVVAEETPVEEAPVEEVVAEETPDEETPVEEAPVEEVPVEETPVEEATAEETPAEEAPAEEAPVEEAPVEEAPAEEAPVEEAPVEEAPVEEAPAEETPVEDAPVEDAPAEEAPVEEAPVEEAPAEEAPVEEAPVEEAPVEEAPAEEAPVEETPVEEAPVEEAPVEEAAAEETPVEETVVAPPKARPDRVVIAETDANGNVIYSAYKKSFTARVIQSPKEVQERYETLKNALLSYKKVNSRVSWSYDSIKSGRKQLAKFAIRGKSLCLFLALDPASLQDSKYNVADAGDSKKYATVPCRLRLSSKRSIKWGLELIQKLAEQEELVPNPKFKPKTWCMENETTESLIEKGLIKKII